MRKCKITFKKQITRTDEELRQLWIDKLNSDNGGIMPMVVDQKQRNLFYTMNRTYIVNEPKFGLFHQWGSESTDDDNGVHEYTVGIVELSDGSIITPLPTYITFLPPDINRKEFEEFAYLGHHNLGRI